MPLCSLQSPKSHLIQLHFVQNWYGASPSSEPQMSHCRLPLSKITLIIIDNLCRHEIHIYFTSRQTQLNITNLAFSGPCVLIYCNNKSHTIFPISQHYFGKQLYIFRTDLLSILRSLNTVCTATGICHTNYVQCLLAWSFSRNSHTLTHTDVVWFSCDIFATVKPLNLLWSSVPCDVSKGKCSYVFYCTYVLLQDFGGPLVASNRLVGMYSWRLE